MGALVERAIAHVRRRLMGQSDRQQQPAVEGEFPHRVIAIVGEIDASVGGDVRTVRVGEDAVAPGSQELSVPVEHHDRMRPAYEGIDVVR